MLFDFKGWLGKSRAYKELAYPSTHRMNGSKNLRLVKIWAWFKAD
jgi:hypothetical protein